MIIIRECQKFQFKDAFSGLQRLKALWLFYVLYTRRQKTEYYNSVPAGTEFQNDHGCEARGVHFSLGPSA